jgi:enoyl-CoA hydratase/carnithine racemase
MILTGASISAEEALKIGLVGRVVPARQIAAEAEVLAGAMASQRATAVRAALDVMSGELDGPFAEGLAREAELFGQLCVTKEKREAIQAFLDKRWSKGAGSEAAKMGTGSV